MKKEYDFSKLKELVARGGMSGNILWPSSGEGEAARAALAVDSGEPEWSAYSGALGRKFLRLDQFLKSTNAKAEENVPNPKLFQ